MLLRLLSATDSRVAPSRLRRGGSVPPHAQAAELTRRLTRNEASQKALITELAHGAAAGGAYRARIRDQDV